LIVMREYNEETLAELLRSLPTAPEAWVQAAQEIPLARSGLDEIIQRAEADAAFRDALVADLESALAAEGYEPDPVLVEALRERFPA
jgi:hypothetical protein